MSHADEQATIQRIGAASDGLGLGTRTVRYEEGRSLLYALAVGAAPTDLDLVYEGRATIALPTMATALGLWVTDASAETLGYSRDVVLHIGQTLELRSPLPLSGAFEVTGSITTILDKGNAGIIHLEARCDAFTAGYVMYVPGIGGFGGDRGSRVSTPPFDPVLQRSIAVPDNVAALYRLTGDDHPVHIDPEVARRAGHDRPIMHGLCTLGMAVLGVLEEGGLDPADVTGLSATWSSPAFPGESLELTAGPATGAVSFSVAQRGQAVCSGQVTTSGRPRSAGVSS